MDGISLQPFDLQCVLLPKHSLQNRNLRNKHCLAAFSPWYAQRCDCVCKGDVGEGVCSGPGVTGLTVSMSTLPNPFSGESLPLWTLLSCFPNLVNSGLKQEEENSF